MATVTTALHRRARTIFSELGYDVTDEGETLRAERKWRTVRVTPMAEPDDPPAAGGLRCFVTWAENAAAVERRLRAAAPDYEWALLGVRDDGYVVHQSPLAPS
jgi:hypothetical protein